MNSTTTAAAFRTPPNTGLIQPKPKLCVTSSHLNMTSPKPPSIPAKLATSETDKLSMTSPKPPYLSTKLTVAHKIQTLALEFKSLTKPIDRVTRLLHYAELLPSFDEYERTDSNKVTGCTAQVWLEVKRNVNGTMRFRVDSDSEITKGFCYCLIWLLDGEDAKDVLEMKVDNLDGLNVGILPVRTSSRVNTWHNVLISMRKRTRELIMQKD